MSKQTMLATTTALALGAVTLVGAGTSSSAASMYAPAISSVQTSAPSTEVEKVMYRQTWRYDRFRNGDRFRYRHGPYVHYYDGYYYSRPWWNYGSSVSINLGSPGYGYAVPYYAPRPVYRVVGGGHVRWCLDHFRSYDPNTDTYVGHDGFRHRCIVGY